MSEPFHPNSAGAALMSDDIAHTFAEQLGVEYPDRYGDRVYDTGNITITNSPAPGTICAGRPRPHDPGTRPGASGDPSGHADAAAVDPVRARERTSDRPTFDHPARARRPPLVPFQPPTPPSLIPPLGGGGLRRTPSQPPPPPEGVHRGLTDGRNARGSIPSDRWPEVQPMLSSLHLGPPRCGTPGGGRVRRHETVAMPRPAGVRHRVVSRDASAAAY
jgi:hypothetical protein